MEKLGTRFVGHCVRGFKNLIESWPAHITTYETYIVQKESNNKTRAKVSGLLKTKELLLEYTKGKSPAKQKFSLSNESYPFQGSS